MKTTDLIALLTNAVEKHGDLEVHIPDQEEGCAPFDIHGLAFCQDEDGKVDSFMICDDATFDAFVDSTDDEEEQ